MAQGLALGLMLGAAGRAAAKGAEAVLQVRYPRMPERPLDGYGYRLLELALNRAGVRYTVSLASSFASGKRADLELESGAANVLDVGLAQDHEARFDPVSFPLDLGLSGCRLFLVRRDTLPALQKVKTLEDLRSFRFGQGPGWTDVPILQEAGLKVQTGQFGALFRMLEARRFDIFPLGADEAHDMLARYQAEAPSVVVADSVALHYPFARMFIVRRDEPILHDALGKGLLKAFADGSLQQVLATQPGLGPLLRGERALPPHMVRIPHPWPTKAYKAIPPHTLHPAVRELIQGRASLTGAAGATGAVIAF